MPTHKLEVTLSGDANALAKAIDRASGKTGDSETASEYTAEESRAAAVASTRAKATTSGALFVAMETCAKNAGMKDASAACLYAEAAKSLAEAWRLLWPRA